MSGVSGEDGPSARLMEIAALVRKHGYVANEDLARTFNVAVQTIRRDIRRLADAGEVVRHHGGASAPSSVENIAYSERQILNHREKEAIGRRAAAEIPDGASLFINIGTTTEAFARSLIGRRGLRVITNNLHVASLLAGGDGCRVVVAGGAVRVRDGGILGLAAQSMLEQYRADYGVIGISGVDDDGTLLDFDPEEILASQTIRRHSRRVFLLADHTKFARRPLVRAGHINEATAFFTDAPPPAGIRDMLAASGVGLHVVDTNVRKRT
ncbi:glycerol-3-phosphate regulon repressor [Acetobacter nitrogenifigens DSM 23921 = NBRC 105050]|uniref:DeoR/GlpR family transcriptional regulator n=2 Tax=Acetobacter nitrogenifigens TaxID=285268 RepID=A0A511X8H1_9PROT|nr:glycerol-3-phosphate regulon repressor [Acetobacter nitrogenifigens DSM 23921 = NBRC 105050]GEN59218.1 DeoR/GlpR family transcriptional regulator [Acetobacter nitrogenifigens DSM 23921 = NBRC 105050]